MKLTQSEALDVHKQIIAKANAIVLDKRKRYSGTVDPFGNFRLAGPLADVEDWQGVLVRLGDKLSRIKQMAKAGITQADFDDLMENDFPDILNYNGILAGLLKEKIK